MFESWCSLCNEFINPLSDPCEDASDFPWGLCPNNTATDKNLPQDCLDKLTDLYATSCKKSNFFGVFSLQNLRYDYFNIPLFCAF